MKPFKKLNNFQLTLQSKSLTLYQPNILLTETITHGFNHGLRFHVFVVVVNEVGCCLFVIKISCFLVGFRL